MVKAISIRKVDGKPGQVYYPLEHITIPDNAPKDNEVVVKITAAALNHRDLFLRQHLYPGTTFGVPLLADGTGVVTSTGSSPEAKKWQGKRVIINPGSGWEDDPDGPENQVTPYTLASTEPQNRFRCSAEDTLSYLLLPNCIFCWHLCGNFNCDARK